MKISLINEQLLFKYFARPSFCRSGYKRQKSFAIYGCCHPCFIISGLMLSYQKMTFLKIFSDVPANNLVDKSWNVREDGNLYC